MSHKARLIAVSVFTTAAATATITIPSLTASWPCVCSWQCSWTIIRSSSHYRIGRAVRTRFRNVVAFRPAASTQPLPTGTTLGYTIRYRAVWSTYSWSSIDWVSFRAETPKGPGMLFVGAGGYAGDQLGSTTGHLNLYFGEKSPVSDHPSIQRSRPCTKNKKSTVRR